MHSGMRKPITELSGYSPDELRELAKRWIDEIPNDQRVLTSVVNCIGLHRGGPAKQKYIDRVNEEFFKRS